MTKTRALRSLRAKLIFNPVAGPNDPEVDLQSMLDGLASVGIQADVYRIHAGSRVRSVVAQAIRNGIELIAVAGGDNTIGQVAAALAGTKAILGVFPTGTRNNIALSLGIPTDLTQAAVLMRHGKRGKVDVLKLEAPGGETVCIETVMVGLGAALFPAADQLQKGDLTQLGGMLSTLISYAPSEIRLTFDGARKPELFQGQLVLLANMPYIAVNVKPAPDISPSDGKLDVLVYPDLGKFELLAYAAQVARGGAVDERIQHRRCKRVKLESTPPLEIMADGVMRGAGALTATLLPKALNVMISTQ